MQTPLFTDSTNRGAFRPLRFPNGLKSDGPLSLRRADAVFGFYFTRREKSVAKNCPRLISLFLRQTLPRRNLTSKRRVGARAGICLPDFNICRTFNQNLGYDNGHG